MARVVINHSTYIKGLIKWLKKLALYDEIECITPGVISKTKGRRDILNIGVSRKTTSGFRLLARKGKLVQEIYIITNLNSKELEIRINECNPFINRKKKDLI